MSNILPELTAREFTVLSQVLAILRQWPQAFVNCYPKRYRRFGGWDPKKDTWMEYGAHFEIDARGEARPV